MTEGDDAEDATSDRGPDVDRDGDASGDANGGVAENDDANGGAAEGDRRKPLGSLRDRVVEDAGDEPAVAFPSGQGSDGDGTRADAEGSRSDAGSERGGDDERDGSGVGGDREGPLGDLAAGVDERRQRRDAVDDELFESVDVGEVDADTLWEQVAAEEPSVATPDSRAVRELDKRKYCAGCPHFSRPPEVHCEHDGTDILGQVDMETFEVADCPIVLEDERLEDAGTD
jgi:hypothetical protein